jgi:hypothetical protein
MDGGTTLVTGTSALDAAFAFVEGEVTPFRRIKPARF